MSCREDELQGSERERERGLGECGWVESEDGGCW